MKSSKDERVKIRPLQRTDPEQTTAQWKEKFIKQIQDESGELAEFIETDKRPSDPGVFPAEPLKPSDMLMPFMIEDFKAKNNLSTNPTPLDIWSQYQRDMASFETAKAKHMSAWKMYSETFPRINKDCFKILEGALTEPTIKSMLHPVLGIPGADKAYQEKDTFAFTKMAIDYVESTGTATTTDSYEYHKTKLDTSRQPEGSRIDEYFAAYSRLEENYVKARGSPLMAFEIAKQTETFVKTLDNSWDSWRENRRLGNTLPKDMTTLIAQLMAEESRRTNEKETAIAKQADMKMSTAHTTTSRPTTSKPQAKTEEALKPVDCAGVVNKRSQPFHVPGHQKTFRPKHKSHFRCDACQNFYKEKLAAGEVDPPYRLRAQMKKGAGKKGKTSKHAHRSDGDEDSAEEDEDYDELEGMMTTHATEGYYVILGEANLSVGL